MKNNTKDIKVSIIIPCYNMGAYVEDAVKSAYAQTFNNYEVIIIDDGSTDENTARKLKSIEQHYPGIQIYHKKNTGLSMTKNYGIERAKGEYIVCLDADDILAPNYLEETVKLIDKKTAKKVAFVTTWVQEFGLRNSIWQTSGYDVTKLLVTNIAHAGSLFRKDVWEEVGGFKKVGVSYEDWEFWLNIAEKGYEWDTIKEPLFLYRIRKNSIMASAKSVHLELYEKLFGLHPSIYKKYADKLVIENARQIRELRDAIEEKNHTIDEYFRAIEYYKKQAESSTDELKRLYGSRITHIALQLIAASIFVRTRLPAVKHRTTRFVKRLFPPFVKRGVHKISSVLFPKEIVMVQNKKWPTNKPLVSIVTPFYNQGEYIAETAGSVLGQTFQNIEYIIVDDGSREEEAKALSKIKDPRVTIIRNKENIGKGSPAAARNLGIKHSSGKYIVCLDGDDTLDPTYVEKALTVLELDPSVGLVTTEKVMFGSMNEPVDFIDYDPLELINNNMVITAAMYRREAWEATGGYKPGIGYEDWEYWINMAEKGFFGRTLKEKIFRYRTAQTSRYIEDKKKHDDNVRTIYSLHPEYRKTVKEIQKSRRRLVQKVDPNSAAVNLSRENNYLTPNNSKKNILFALPWMTFGGAETLIVNFCNEIKDDFNISFVTGIESDHEWQDKFSAISSNIYHLPKMFGGDTELYIEFISNYITTRSIDTIHIIHTSFMFPLLPELKKRHPSLKVVLTLFNDRAHFNDSLKYESYIDVFTTDNSSVARHYDRKLTVKKDVVVIPNGINCYGIFNPDLYNRAVERSELGIAEEDLAIFFIGRLSEEKNPDVFLKVAKTHMKDLETQNVKFFVIGDGVMRGDIEKTIADIDSPNVQYLGYQSDIAKYLSTADVFVLPSSIEGFPLSILEAMAMNVAVVASDVGAVSEIIDSGANGFVVSPGSAAEITEVITRLKTEVGLLDKIKGKAREQIEQKYSNTILGENYMKMYKGLPK